jgi:hypothetical protein
VKDHFSGIDRRRILDICGQQKRLQQPARRPDLCGPIVNVVLAVSQIDRWEEESAFGLEPF